MHWSIPIAMVQSSCSHFTSCVDRNLVVLGGGFPVVQVKGNHFSMMDSKHSEDTANALVSAVGCGRCTSDVASELPASSNINPAMESTRSASDDTHVHARNLSNLPVTSRDGACGVTSFSSLAEDASGCVSFFFYWSR